jgi:hypothetical protein
MERLLGGRGDPAGWLRPSGLAVCDRAQRLAWGALGRAATARALCRGLLWVAVKNPRHERHAVATRHVSPARAHKLSRLMASLSEQ